MSDKKKDELFNSLDELRSSSKELHYILTFNSESTRDQILALKEAMYKTRVLLD